MTREGKNVLFVWYPTCSTCQRAKKWLDEHGVKYEERNIKEQPPTYEELRGWQARSGLELKSFFNTSGLVYRGLGLKDKLGDMSADEQLRLLASNGMLVKRPIVADNQHVLVGFREEKWSVLCSNIEGKR